MAKKTLCTWDKDQISRQSKKLKRIISEPGFYCRKCARVSSDEKYLCKPEPLR